MEIDTSCSSSVVCVISPQSSGVCPLLRNKAALQQGQSSGCVSPAAPGAGQLLPLTSEQHTQKWGLEELCALLDQAELS